MPYSWVCHASCCCQTINSFNESETSQVWLTLHKNHLYWSLQGRRLVSANFPQTRFILGKKWEVNTDLLFPSDQQAVVKHQPMIQPTANLIFIHLIFLRLMSKFVITNALHVVVTLCTLGSSAAAAACVPSAPAWWCCRCCAPPGRSPPRSWPWRRWPPPPRLPGACQPWGKITHLGGGARDPVFTPCDVIVQLTCWLASQWSPCGSGCRASRPGRTGPSASTRQWCWMGEEAWFLVVVMVWLNSAAGKFLFTWASASAS